VEACVSTETVIRNGGPDKDRVLAFRAKDGDREALGELFVRHSPSVRWLLRSVLGPGSDLDDLVQDVFVQVHRSLPRFKGEARFGTWLHRLTVNVAVSHMRRSRKRHIPSDPQVIDRLDENRVPNAHDKLVVKEMVRRFYAVLQTLTPKRQAAFALFAVEGRSIVEAAEMAGVSSALMKSRIWFARREFFKKAGQDPYLGPLLDEMVK
jgi:RNA polymerase sigma-70 factor (ECF subfamily)